MRIGPARAVAIWMLAVVIGSAGQAPPPSPALVVKPLSGEALRLSLDELSKLPQARSSATGHDGKTHQYEGVSLRDLLTKAGVPTGDSIRGKELADYVPLRSRIFPCFACARYA